MFERFTDEARRVVVMAQEESRLLAHNWIGTEHLLLGVLHHGGVVADALAPFGLTLDGARDEVRARTSPQGEVTGHIPFTADAKSAMEKALREALQLGDDFIGTAHLMLGVLGVEDGLALQIVTDLTGDVDEIRAWLRENRSLRGGTAPAPGESQVTLMATSAVGGMRMPSASDAQRCAFCDRDLWEVEASVAGRGIAICAGCVAAAADALRDAAATGLPTPEPLPLPPRVFGDPSNTAAAAEVVAALRGAITTELTTEERIASVDDGATVIPLLEQAGGRFAGQVHLVIGAVRLLGDDHAQVRYEMVLGDGPRFPFTGDVDRRDGRWIVSRETIAAMVRRAGIHVPPPES